MQRGTPPAEREPLSAPTWTRSGSCPRTGSRATCRCPTPGTSGWPSSRPRTASSRPACPPARSRPSFDNARHLGDRPAPAQRARQRRRGHGAGAPADAPAQRGRRDRARRRRSAAGHRPGRPARPRAGAPARRADRGRSGGRRARGLLTHVGTSLEARRRSEEQVRRFVADASHELRTPLTTIAGYVELARRRPDDTDATRTALAKVEEEAGRMTGLVEDLLLLARLDAGRPLARESVDVTRLLLEAVTDARVVAPDHRWHVDVPDGAVEVTGDEQRLHEVVTNLLTNARKYTPAGSTVTARAHVVEGRAVVEVHDDGPRLRRRRRLPRLRALHTAATRPPARGRCGAGPGAGSRPSPRRTAGRLPAQRTRRHDRLRGAARAAGRSGCAHYGGRMSEDQLQPEDTLDDRGVDDVLDEGISPPEAYRGVTAKGTTTAEQIEGETIDDRLGQEEPEVWRPPASRPSATPPTPPASSTATSPARSARSAPAASARTSSTAAWPPRTRASTAPAPAPRRPPSTPSRTTPEPHLHHRHRRPRPGPPGTGPSSRRVSESSSRRSRFCAVRGAVGGSAYAVRAGVPGRPRPAERRVYAGRGGACGGQRTAGGGEVKAEPSSRGVPWQLKVLPVKQR